MYIKRIKNRLRKITLKILFGRNKGFYVLSEPWNYLIILDACRYDIFKEVIKKFDLNGRLEYRVSRGSNTTEFLMENFGRGYYHDIVYVTANPFVDLLLKDRFYKIISVWKYGWSDELNTVHPREVFKYALKAIIAYPDKRIIVHFMQPHYPFITMRSIKTTGISWLRSQALRGGSVKKQDTHIWMLVASGKVPLEVAINKYRENLEIAMEYVIKLIDYLHGKIVITSDHGEAFGERMHFLIPKRIYGHVSGVRIKPLVKVPWYVIYKPYRRDKRIVTRMELQKRILMIKDKLNM